MEIRDLHLFSFPCLRLHSKYLDSSLSLLSTSSIGLSQVGQCLFEARHPCSWRNETIWFDVLVASIIWNIVIPLFGALTEAYGTWYFFIPFSVCDVFLSGFFLVSLNKSPQLFNNFPNRCTDEGSVSKSDLGKEALMTFWSMWTSNLSSESIIESGIQSGRWLLGIFLISSTPLAFCEGTEVRGCNHAISHGAWVSNPF